LAKKQMLLYGKNSVLERLRRNPESIHRVILQEKFDHPEIKKLIQANSIAVQRVSSRELSNIKQNKDLQGIVARVDNFKYGDFNELIDSPEDKRPALIFLDRINDPQNLGVIIRLAACFGGFALVIPDFQSCGVTEAVLHVASGGENYLSVCKVGNLTQAVLSAKKKGYWIAGALANEDAEDIQKFSFSFPLGIVLGSEGEGIRHGLRKHLDTQVHIPMSGAALSFNVSMACAILCYEIVKQRGVGK